ncbi:MAG: sialidase family protein [Capsulimonadaceae bacterium]|nr:sialidase family protein [Capsulimonadaceae bacterium]
MTDTSAEDLDLALLPVTPNLSPSSYYATTARPFQGIPGIERASGGRLWATWYAGGDNEGPLNYVLLVTSGDDGATWPDPVLVVDPPANIRAFDPVVWHDPQGRLWLFWAQGVSHWDGRGGVWAIHTNDSNSASPAWSAPERIADGVMMNKPTVLSNGEWLLPVAIWGHQPIVHPAVDPANRTPHVVASGDQGRTWQLRGGPSMENRSYDEHMVVERKDGSLWMLTRLHDGIGESVSTDGGLTWTAGRKSNITHIDSRFFIRSTRSGQILLVKHHNNTGRSHLTAFLSSDDGATWQGGLVIDERADVSYPDGVEYDGNKFLVIYDRERYAARDILLARFTADDVLAGKIVAPASTLKQLVNRAS